MKLGTFVRKTRSGTVFSGWLDETAFNAGSNLDEEHALDDDIDGLDEEPLLDPSGVDNEFDNTPLNQVDDKRPPSPSTSEPPPKKRKRNDVIFEDVVATGRRRGCHRRRSVKLAAQKKKHGHVPRKSTIEKHVKPAVHIPAPLFDTLFLPTTSSAYLAKNETPTETRGAKKRYSLKELLKLGFTKIEWDGIAARPLADRHGRIFANKYQQTSFPAAFRNHRRGLFAAINVGLTRGTGQAKPTWLDGGEYSEVAERLLADQDINRMAEFADSAFALWAPRKYDHYRDNNKKLDAQCPGLRRPFPGSSVFSCAAFNLGLNIWTFRHRDVRNLPYGWCGVQAMGHFDATKGGHLILWQIKVVVGFPAGALILLPSATIAHSNIPVQAGDERVSFTQFTSGALFMYTDNNGKTQAKLEEEDPEGFARLEESRKSRWAEGLVMFSTVDEIFGAQN
ncbi:hypothetical protein R3P38DRAFT_3332572 [Favolaschia claudopus]|uniref:Uncharacterized protein n=1 Tax=Favolaschia claudopus TaxID=2862362 RepID=A0AAV9ZLJ1_9AGAR